MDSFDQSLKHLLQLEPAGFIRFALGDPTVQVLGPLPSGLPARGRDVDGAYHVAFGDARRVAHVEFNRRHQSAEELAVDVAEAQIRFFRRERVKVLSLVWDLYGAEGGAVVDRRTLEYGAESKGGGSRAVYLRVNLRAMGWRTLLAKSPSTLWPLVALARGGATEEAVHHARDAITARADLDASRRADHLAVLWFVAEAEDVPVRVMREYITEQQLMASTLYQEIFHRGEARGEAKVCAETVVRVLSRRMGALDPALRERIGAVADMKTLKEWYDEALTVVDAEGAARLADKIGKAPLHEREAS